MQFHSLQLQQPISKNSSITLQRMLASRQLATMYLKSIVIVSASTLFRIAVLAGTISCTVSVSWVSNVKRRLRFSSRRKMSSSSAYFTGDETFNSQTIDDYAPYSAASPA